LISFDCNECKKFPELRKQLSCDAPSQDAVWEDGENEFFNCPVRFISQAVSDWYNEHAYNDRYKSARMYEKQAETYIEALDYYDRCMGKFKAIKARQGTNNGRE
jgi:hypothetical protein